LALAAAGVGDRVADGSLADGIPLAGLAQRARRAGTFLAELPGVNVVLVDESSLAVPLALFGAAVAGKPYVPVSYRLADDRLQRIVERAAPGVLIAGEGVADRLGPVEGVEIMSRAEFLVATEDESIAETDGWGCD